MVSNPNNLLKLQVSLTYHRCEDDQKVRKDDKLVSFEGHAVIFLQQKPVFVYPERIFSSTDRGNLAQKIWVTNLLPSE